MYNEFINKQSGKKMFQVNQIVKGKFAGYFVILGFRTIGGVASAQLKSVDPSDYSRTALGELALPLDVLEVVQKWT
jgi:hypothetical protein|tara:strand:- start:375 stop:602 length:228 start_codon:yes stop_codon:yes gene_type:complete